MQREVRNLLLVSNKADVVRASGNTRAERRIPGNAHLLCSTRLPARCLMVPVHSWVEGGISR